MHITMVKKRLPNGDDCRKCAEAEDILRKRGLWGVINEVVVANPDDPNCAGSLLGREYAMDTAPFFIVKKGGNQPSVYKSVLQFVRSQQNESVAPAKAAEEPAQVAERLANAEPNEIVCWGLETFGERCAIAFSGAEDVVLIDLAARTGLPFSVFCLDTGRLHAETYQYIERVRKHYSVEIQMFSSQPGKLEPFICTKGLFSFYEDGHKECCSIRKVQPLRRALGHFDAWITGQRHDQNPDTRATIALVEEDTAFEGKHGKLVKLKDKKFNRTCLTIY
jgi:hypothetical protein